MNEDIEALASQHAQHISDATEVMCLMALARGYEICDLSLTNFVSTSIDGDGYRELWADVVLARVRVVAEGYRLHVECEWLDSQ